MRGDGPTLFLWMEGQRAAPGRGVGKALERACEERAEAQGCEGFAGDCALDNCGSIAMHLALGFEEKAKSVCFGKCLRGAGHPWMEAMPR